jgi:Tol biopolymer transport system component
VKDFTRIERRLPQLLTELAEPRTPDYFERIVHRTAVSTQRPAWTFLERWIPMSVATFRGSFASNAPWRNLALLALLILAIVAGIVAMGSRPRPLPAPFGPAQPGLVAYDAGGDILTADPATGAIETLVGGPEPDSQPQWSLDGSRLAFQREAGENRSHVFVTDGAGERLTRLTQEALVRVRDLVFSPDGEQLLITSSRDARATISVAATDGSGVRTLDLDQTASLPSFRPPDGRSFLFVGGDAFSGAGQGVFTYDLATGNVRAIIDLIPGAEIVGRPTYSPDGTRIAYGVWVPGQDVNARVYTANADGTGSQPVPHPDTCCEANPVWSNDGTRLAFTRWRWDDTRLIAVVPWDQGGVGMEFEIPFVYRGIASWSPDDKWILVTPTTTEDGSHRSPQVLLDIERGEVRAIGWETESDPAIQRLAP